MPKLLFSLQSFYSPPPGLGWKALRLLEKKIILKEYIFHIIHGKYQMIPNKKNKCLDEIVYRNKHMIVLLICRSIHILVVEKSLVCCISTSEWPLNSNKTID